MNVERKNFEKFYSCCEKGVVSDVSEMLKEGKVKNLKKFDINSHLRNFSAIHAVCFNGYCGVLQVLLKENTLDVNRLTKPDDQGKGQTALYYACKNGDIEIIKELLLHPNIDLKAGIPNPLDMLGDMESEDIKDIILNYHPGLFGGSYRINKMKVQVIRRELEDIFYNVNDGNELSQLVNLVRLLNDRIKREFYPSSFGFDEQNFKVSKILSILQKVFGWFFSEALVEKKRGRTISIDKKFWKFFEQYTNGKSLLDYMFSGFRDGSVLLETFSLPSDSLRFCFQFSIEEYYIWIQKRYVPVYFGEFNSKNEYHGKGKKFEIENEKNIFKIYEGEFANGKKEGKFEVFDKKLNGKKVFRGSYRKDLRDGKGVEYVYNSELETVFVTYEGTFSKDKRHGRGESIHPKSGEVVRGYWEKGNLDENSVSKYDCPVVKYERVEKHLSDKNVIGRGGFGIVYEVKTSAFNRGAFKNLKDKNVAVKIMKVISNSSSMKEVLMRMTRRGTSLSQMVNSPHILETYGIISGWNKVGCVMKLCECSVDKLIEKERLGRNKGEILDLSEKMRILYETSLGIQALHKMYIMHRDLKWGNVLVGKDGVIKLTDFDTMKEDELLWRLETIAHSSNIGTTGFLAPEVFLGKKFSLKSDVFAFGLMIYSLLWERNVPYSTQFQCCKSSIEEIFRTNSLDYHVANCNFRPLLDPKEVGKHSKHLIELMIECWDQNPFNRPSFEEIVFRLKLAMKQKKKKVFVVVELQFPKHEFITSQKMYLVKPFQVRNVFSWIESKFALPPNEKSGRQEEEEEEGESEGGKLVQNTKVRYLNHPVLGSILTDEDLQKVIEKSMRQSVTIEVELENLREEFVRFKSTERKISMEEFRKLEERNLELEEEIRRKDATNLTLRREIIELKKKLSSTMNE